MMKQHIIKIIVVYDEEGTTDGVYEDGHLLAAVSLVDHKKYKAFLDVLPYPRMPRRLCLADYADYASQITI